MSARGRRGRHRGRWLIAGAPRLIAVALAAGLAAAPPEAAAQPAREIDEVRRELEEIRKGQDAILKELQDLRTLLLGASRRGQGPRTDVVLSLEAARFLGSARAPVVLVEFSDFQCPFCARHARETVPRLEREYVRPGKLRYVFRDFPVVGLHPRALKGHEAARCAGDQGKFWEMHAWLFANPRTVEIADLERQARNLDLDAAGFGRCLASDKHAEAVRRDLEEGRRAGVSGTPAFFLGLADPAQPRLRVARAISGSQPYETFREAIEALLAQSSGLSR
jgi:protein-disulfide isomerase